MSAKDYMKVNSDKTVTINLNNYTGDAFVDAVKIRDIAKITILSRDKRKSLGRGADDVLIQYASGGKERISRKKLASDYLTKSGKKIKLSHLKDNTTYLVISNKPKNYAVMMLPTNMRGVLNGKTVPAGCYIVAPKNQNGEIDTSKMTVISKNKFRKMFKIPPQDIITRNMTGGGNKVSRRIISYMNNPNRNRKINNIGTENESGLGSNLGNSMRLNKPASFGGGMNIGKNIQRPVNNQTKPAQLKMVGRLFSNSTNELIGYLFIDVNGKQYKKNIIETMKLCSEHKVCNAMLQRHPNGKMFLRGSAGTIIERLPKYIV